MALPQLDEYSVDFRNAVVTQIEQCWTPVAGNTVNPVGPPGAFRGQAVFSNSQRLLSEILLTRDWWRMYVLPRNWPAARQNNRDNPGAFYNRQEAQDSDDDEDEYNRISYQTSLEYQYAGYLDDPNEIGLVLDMTWNKVCGMHRLDRKFTTYGTSYVERYIEHNNRTSRGIYPATTGRIRRGGPIDEPCLDGALLREKVPSGFDDGLHTQVPSFIAVVPDMTGEAFVRLDDAMILLEQRILPSTGTRQWRYVSNPSDHWRDVFNHYWAEMRTRIRHPMTEPMDSLKAIAKFGRAMMMLQPFENNNTRTFQTILLPMLLLHLGFGLPLGGANRTRIEPRAYEAIWMGAFDIETIAKFLWVTQDFGRISDPARGISCLNDQ